MGTTAPAPAPGHHLRTPGKFPQDAESSLSSMPGRWGWMSEMAAEIAKSLEVLRGFGFKVATCYMFVLNPLFAGIKN